MLTRTGAADTDGVFYHPPGYFCCTLRLVSVIRVDQEQRVKVTVADMTHYRRP